MILHTRLPCLQGVTEPHFSEATSLACGMSRLIPQVCFCDTNIEGCSATSFTCASYKIFPTEDSDESQAVLKYGCMMNWAADSLYRTLPARYASSTAAPEKTETASDSSSASKCSI
jgi:hypothetical protein